MASFNLTPEQIHIIWSSFRSKHYTNHELDAAFIAVLAGTYAPDSGGKSMPKLAKSEVESHYEVRSKTGEFIAEFESELSRKIVGQTEAVDAIVRALKTHLTKMQPPGRPIANLLFLGQTGSGKTRTVEAATETLYGGCKDAFVKIDCAEFQHSHEIAKLIGSPPGYIGHRETTPILTQERLNMFHNDKTKISFVLFDEIEKASDAMWQLMLGIMDKGIVTTGDNRKVDFSQCVIVMTSNLGASEMSKFAGQSFGFAPKTKVADIDAKFSGIALDAAKKKFSPEFMNRIDKVVVFHALQTADLTKILELELRAVQERILHAECPAFILEWTPAACQLLLKLGTSAQYGARELKRTIEKHVVHGLADVLLGPGVDNADTLTIDVGPNETIIFHHTPR